MNDNQMVTSEIRKKHCDTMELWIFIFTAHYGKEPNENGHLKPYVDLGKLSGGVKDILLETTKLLKHLPLHLCRRAPKLSG